MAVTRSAKKPASTPVRPHTPPNTALVPLSKTKHSKDAKRADKKYKSRDKSHPSLGRAAPKSSSKPGAGTILLMPCEITQLIASFLDLASLGKFRLTCAEIESKTFWYFSNAYFKHKDFFPSRYGLEALVDISKSRLAPYVRTLGFGPACNDQGMAAFAQNHGLLPAEKDQITAAMYKYAETNREMRMLGEDAYMIRTAIQNMRGITTLKFLDESPWEYKHSYGKSHLQEVATKHGVFERVQLSACQSMSRLFLVASRAAEAACLKLECIDMRKASDYTTLDFMDWGELDPTIRGFASFPLRLPTAPIAGGPLSPTFANISVLRIPISCPEELMDKARRQIFLDRLTTFLTALPRLHTLGLYFGEGPGTGETVKHLRDSDVLKKLKNFELGCVQMCTHSLADFLEPLSGNLEGLSLLDIPMNVFGWFSLVRWISLNMENLKELAIHPNDEESPLPALHCKEKNHDDFIKALEYEKLHWREYLCEIDYEFDEDMFSDFSDGW